LLLIRSQRKRHLIMWLVLAPLIIAGFCAGLVARSSAPVENSEPGSSVDIAETAR
jgi:hypothetical protein